MRNRSGIPMLTHDPLIIIIQILAYKELFSNDLFLVSISYESLFIVVDQLSPLLCLSSKSDITFFLCLTFHILTTLSLEHLILERKGDTLSRWAPSSAIGSFGTFLPKFLHKVAILLVCIWLFVLFAHLSVWNLYFLFEKLKSFQI